MNRKRTTALLVAFATVFSLLVVLGRTPAISSLYAKEQSDNLEVRLSPTKKSFIQGEVVGISVEVTNRGESDVQVLGADAQSGYLRLFVAGEDQKFKEYSHSAWGRKTTRGRIIKPGQTIKSDATLLWNFSPVGRFASTKDFEGNQIMTDLAFEEPGIYFIKSVLIVPKGENDSQRIESAPVQIIVDAPVGNDLEVWKEVKKNPEIAYFIQENELRTTKEGDRQKQLTEIERVVAANPNSFLARQLGQSLEKFRASEAKRKGYMQKVKKQQSLRN